jgi:hypothetical protein
VNHQGAGATDVQLQNLLQIVARKRDERCTVLLDEARAQARQLLQQARREARERLHLKVLAIREQARQQLASAQAQRETRLRLQRHRGDHALLDRAWGPLGERLQQRWEQAGSRQLWIEHLVEQGLAKLLDRRWRIEHPVEWPEQEREALGARLERELGNPPVFVAQPQLAAGLRICAGPTCIDATPEGLLRARSHIESMMLATLNECRRKLADKARAGARS